MTCNDFRLKVADLFDKEVDEQLRAECEEHMLHCAECRAYYDGLLMVERALKPTDTSSSRAGRQMIRPLRVAAVFLGVLIVSVVALATVYLVKPSTEPITNKQGEAAVKTAVQPAETLEVRFDDVRLDSILVVVAPHYGKQVRFDADHPKTMRLIMVWNPDEPLADFIERLNMFDGLQLHMQGDTIVVTSVLEEEQP